MKKTPSPKFNIRYDKSEITYATQFLVSPGKEEVLLDLSSGLLNDGSEPQTLPIQTRVALPWSSVERLANILNQVIAAKQQQSNQSPRNATTPAPSVPHATMPRMSSEVVN